MKNALTGLFLVVTLFLTPRAAWTQSGFGGRGGGMGGMGRYGPSAPKLPGVELIGPLDTALARVTLDLTSDQVARYAQAYDSFMVATRPQRDSASAAIAKMNERLDGGDRAAATFYAERVQELGKYLKERQDRFESELRRFLNGDQVKAYKKWREGEDQAAERKRREDQLRWDEAGFRGEFGGPRASSTPDIKTALPTAPAVAVPALGSQAVRVGRALYVAGQLGVDSTGALVGSDLRAQAVRAFANLGTVLQAAGATPRDVIALTIYIVNYRPEDLATIRDAGAAYFGAKAAIATVVGVQSVGRDGALISIGATAMAH
ncbi:MAG TPA: RidA family protein [Gemmatimonadales bacterium]|jgi:enamine deaminase RidA (YjgF/YER057c/UK114 family)|nr:RidA family protein [Gemmatimonadales bacterium]